MKCSHSDIHMNLHTVHTVWLPRRSYAWSCANNNTRICNDAWLCHHGELLYFYGPPFVVPTKGEHRKPSLHFLSVLLIYIQLIDVLVDSLLFYMIVYRKWWRTVSLSTSLILQRKLCFGILPRYAKDDKLIRWFELPNCFIFHNGMVSLAFCWNS